MTDQKALQILVITSRPLVDSQNRPLVMLDVDEERRRVRDALKNAGAAVHVHFLPHATTGAVTEILARDWDVVHITGHGSSAGELLLEDEFGVSHSMNAQDVVEMFGGHVPRVVVLSLCYSGKALPDTLLNAGVCAVIAIDADEPIPDIAATLFSGTFFGMLAGGKTVREAFERAQTRVRLDSQVGNQRFAVRGEKGIPYSQRFTLEGDGTFTFVSEAGAYEETGIPRALGNLHTRNRNFVGRANEIVEVVQAMDARGGLQNVQRVAIWGAGGIGKTELAQAVAWWYAERGRVDAVLWASVSPAESNYILRDLASLLAIAGRAFQLNFSEQMKFDEQIAIVREFFMQHRVLLVLDNWETLVNDQTAREVWEFVKDLPAPTRVLVTSRDILPARDARNIELDTLTPEDAADLFLTITRNAGYFDRNPQWYQESAFLDMICGRLGGYALAIEVVAGQTWSRTLRAIWEDLDKIPKNALEGKDEFGEPRGIWTSLDFSYNVLSEPEKQLFRQMGILLAPVILEDIAAITQFKNPYSVLGELVKRSLVRFREGKYALLPIVRDYAESRLDEAGQDSRELHVHAAQHFDSKGTIPDKLASSDHLFELATKFQVSEAARFFKDYLKGFYQELILRGYWTEARRKTEQLISVARVLGDEETERGALADLATRYYEIGNFERSLQLRERAQKLAEASGDQRLVAVSLHNRAMLMQDQGNYAEAMHLYNESLRISRELGDKSGIASTLHHLGLLAEQRGKYPEAMRYYQESLKLEQELKNKKGIAGSLGQMGVVLQLQGKYEEAKQLYSESLQIHQALGDKLGTAGMWHQMGRLAQDQGKYDEALGFYGQSLKLKKELGNKSGIVNTLGQMGVISSEQGRNEEAMQFFQESLQLAEELGDQRGIANAFQEMGMIAQEEHNYREALRLHRESLKIRQELGDKSGIALSMAAIGNLAYEHHEFKEALYYLMRALILFEELQSPNQDAIMKSIGQIRQRIGAEQFNSWLGELAEEANASLPVPDETSTGQGVDKEYWKFVEAIKEIAEFTVEGVFKGNAEAKQVATKQLTQLEKQARANNNPEIAEFFVVMRGLLANADVQNIIESLAEPYKEIALNAWKELHPE